MKRSIWDNTIVLRLIVAGIVGLFLLFSEIMRQP